MSVLGDSGYNDPVLLATAGYDKTIKFWQPHSEICHKTIPHPDSQVNALAFMPTTSSSSLHMAAAGFQHIRLYDFHSANPQPTTKYEDLVKNVTSIGFQSEAKWMYSTGEDCSARIWDLRSSTSGMGCSQKVVADSPVNCACLHPNQVELFFGDQNGSIHQWDLRSQQRKKDDTLKGQDITSISIDAEGTNMAAVTDQGTCYIWNLQTSTTGASTKLQSKPKQRINSHRKYALKCIFSPDSTMLATTSADCTIRIWKTIDFSLICELAEPDSQRWVWDCAFSDDARYLLSASSDSVARLWDVDTGKVERKYEGHTKAITALAFIDSCT